MSTPTNADRLRTLQAQFSALGCELTQYPPDDKRGPLHLWFFGQVRVFNDLDQAGDFLPMVGGVAEGPEKGGGHE